MRLMKQKKILVAGLLSSPLFFQSCENVDSVDELNAKLEHRSEENSNKDQSVSIKIDDASGLYLEFLNNLSNEIKNDPSKAKEFLDNPNKYCAERGFNNVNMTLDNSLVRFISLLGDKELNKSVMEGNVNKYIALCKEKGMFNMDKLKKDPFILKLSNEIKERSMKTRVLAENGKKGDGIKIEDPELTSVVYGFLAAVIAAVAVEAVVVLGTTLFVTHVHSDVQATVDHKLSSSEALKVWLSKNKLNDTYIIEDKVKKNIVDEGLKVLKTNFPEITSLLSEKELRNLIYLNVNSHE